MTDAKFPEDYVTIKKASEILDLSHHYVWHLVKIEKIKSIEIGNIFYILLDDVIEYNKNRILEKKNELTDLLKIQENIYDDQWYENE